MSHDVISPTLAVFLFASLLLAITPGPAVMGRYITGFSFIALGIFVACGGSRPAR
jgi:hypothetical protein